MSLIILFTRPRVRGVLHQVYGLLICHKQYLILFSRSSDIITLLVNIYGSKEIFVEEYASLLAERLLNGTSDTQKEILYMELLKVRFGEVAMNNCEVMLNDVKYSKRLHTQIIEEKLQRQLSLPLDVLVVSVQFWPEVKDLTLKVPDEVNYRKKNK